MCVCVVCVCVCVARGVAGTSSRIPVFCTPCPHPHNQLYLTAKAHAHSYLSICVGSNPICPLSNLSLPCAAQRYMKLYFTVRFLKTVSTVNLGQAGPQQEVNPPPSVPCSVKVTEGKADVRLDRRTCAVCPKQLIVPARALASWLATDPLAVSVGVCLCVCLHSAQPLTELTNSTSFCSFPPFSFQSDFST